VIIVENKVDTIALFSIILSVVLFFFPLEYIVYAVFFLCVGISIAFVKGIWIIGGWASNKFEELK